MIRINIADNATPAQASRINALRGTGAVMAGARGVANLLRDFFAELEAHRPNKQGFHREHFWSEVRRSVQNPVSDGSDAVVEISDFRFRQRLEGGDIVPGAGKKYLTLPAVDEAYGKRAREFPNLKFAIVEDPRSGRMRPALVAMRGTATLVSKSPRAKRFKAIGEELGQVSMYWLVRHVHQNPDPSVLPSGEQLGEAALTAVDEWFKEREARAAAQN